MIYFILFYCLSILVLLNNTKLLKYVVFGLYLLAVLRFGIGTDYFSYELIFQYINSNPIYELLSPNRVEILFRFLMSVFKMMKLPFEVFIVFVATVQFTYLSKIINRFSSHKSMSYLVFYSFFYLVWIFSGLRQGLAMTIGLYYLLDCLKEDNTKKLIISTAFLFLIHNSAIILLPTYIFAKQNFSKKMILNILLFSFVISLFPLERFSYLLSSLPFIGKALIYVTPRTSIIDKQTILRLPFLILLVLNYSKISVLNSFNKRVLDVSIFSFVIYFTFKFSELTAARLSLYPQMIYIIVFPLVFGSFTRFQNIVISRSALIGLSFIMFINQLNIMYNQVEIENNAPFESTRYPYIHLLNQSDFTFHKKNRYEGK